MTDFKELLPQAKWYCVDAIHRVTACASEDDAKDIAASSFVKWPHLGPYLAVQLVPVDDLRGLLERLDAAEKVCQMVRDHYGASLDHRPAYVKAAYAMELP
jgi:hypothetical protein